jgi:hypothetical protein
MRFVFFKLRYKKIVFKFPEKYIWSLFNCYFISPYLFQNVFLRKLFSENESYILNFIDLLLNQLLRPTA